MTNPACEGCGGPHPFDTSLTSPIWNAVIRSKGLPDYLCLTCIVRIFAADGLSFTAVLNGNDFTDTAIEVTVNGARAKDVDLLSNEFVRLRVTAADAAAEIEHAVGDLRKGLTSIWESARLASFVYSVPGRPRLEWDKLDEEGDIVVRLLGVKNHHLVAHGKTEKEALYMLGEMLALAFEGTPDENVQI